LSGGGRLLSVRALASERRCTVQAGAARAELDELTLSRAQRGDGAAFRVLVETYQRPVFALLSRMLTARGLSAQVEDIAQETFVRVHRALPEFGRDGRRRLGGWILTIAARLAIDELRRRAPEPLGEPDRLAQLPGPARTDEPAERRALRAAIERAVERLSPEHRAAFLLREVHGLDYEAIAGALGIDLGTVKSRLGRARAALRQALRSHQP
jgi:RNA polymerase sigma-70 factor (ECF subfamily)